MTHVHAWHGTQAHEWGRTSEHGRRWKQQGKQQSGSGRGAPRAEADGGKQGTGGQRSSIGRRTFASSVFTSRSSRSHLFPTSSRTTPSPAYLSISCTHVFTFSNDFLSSTANTTMIPCAPLRRRRPGWRQRAGRVRVRTPRPVRRRVRPHGPRDAPIVAGGDGPEALLPGRIPHLQLDHLAVHLNGGQRRQRSGASREVGGDQGEKGQ